jgi:hypothetical protein
MGPRVVTGIIGAFFLLQGVNWLVNPAAAAEALGMPLLEGMARSTQMGDIGAFFIALGVMSLLGAYRSNAQWLHAAALLIGTTAVMRTLAWALQGAAFATMPIAVEVVCTAVLLFAASRFAAAGESPAS